jgi:hypothetical protein
MDKLSKTYTLNHSGDGWRVDFSTGIAPAFGMASYYSLIEVIERVEKLYPEYRPKLNATQLADYGFQLQTDKITRQMVELREGLLDLIKRLPNLSVSHDRRDIPDTLTVLQHHLSDLRAHVDIANREVVLAKMVRQPENGVGRDGHRSPSVNGFIRGVQGGRIPERRSMER